MTSSCPPNSFILESLQSADSNALGAQLHRYGGLQPAGAFAQPLGTRRLRASTAHALLYDQTHDNPSPMERHSLFDFLPRAGLVAMGCCATGSVRGYDELVPHHINVVTEERLYSTWAEASQSSNAENPASGNTGIVCAKGVLNRLHQWMAAERYIETFVDQVCCHFPSNAYSFLI
ncbi:unnamed protein product [Protopolystoma xenopodis]|uniref:Uncharacterized protein n=1 Tax=Protopolystoma xenopodis TaxID=117903 RepID=A0A448WG43_9PLAT|nr:unnamed protein product [Protopolystoma xenopodis]